MNLAFIVCLSGGVCLEVIGGVSFSFFFSSSLAIRSSSVHSLVIWRGLIHSFGDVVLEISRMIRSLFVRLQVQMGRVHIDCKQLQTGSAPALS